MAKGFHLPEPVQIGPYKAWVDAAFQHPEFSVQLNGIEELFRGAAEDANPRDDVVLNAVLSTGHGEKLFSVKRFGKQALGKDWADRLTATEAFRAFNASKFLGAADVQVPVPVAALEHWEAGRLVASYYISEHLVSVTSFKDALIALYTRCPYSEDLMDLLQVVADGVRAMHDAGFFHRDLGNQNILLKSAGRFKWTDPTFVDLSRGRCVMDVSIRQRAFDFSRIYLPSDLLRIFKEMYFSERAPKDFQLWETRYRKQFDLHTRSRRFRHPLRERRRAATREVRGQYPDTRDVWIWDEKSSQAINIVRSRERNAIYPTNNYRKVVGSVMKGFRPIMGDFKQRRAECFKFGVDMKDKIGISLEPHQETYDREFGLLEELGRIPTHLRFYHHQDASQMEFRLRVVKDLLSAGFPVAVTLVQDRRAITNATSWTRFVYRILDELEGRADYVQVGHAVNRVKWGVWDYNEYNHLVDPAFRYAQQNPEVKLIGPGMIDFEYHQLIGLLRHLPAHARFYGLGHLLYVDRRGAPENKQGPFNTVDKCVLARAIARNFPAVEDRLVITEVNWPLNNTGIWSPVGSPYLFPGQLVGEPSVSEEVYANYMIRYLLLAVCSGQAERVYWWRLVARGFGLVDDTDPKAWRKRPAFDMLKHFLDHMKDAQFTWLEEDEGKWIFHFNSDSLDDFAIAYAQEGERLWLNERFGKLSEAGGETLSGSTNEIVLTSRPRYFRDNMHLYGKGGSHGAGFAEADFENNA